LGILKELETAKGISARDPRRLSSAFGKAADNLEALVGSTDLTTKQQARYGLEIEKLRTNRLKEMDKAMALGVRAQSQFGRQQQTGATGNRQETAKSEAERVRSLTSEERYRRSVEGRRTQQEGEAARLNAAEAANRERVRRQQQAVFDRARRDSARPPPKPQATFGQRLVSGFMPEQFALNVAKVTGWAAAVGVLYKAVNLAQYSLSRLADTGLQMARLDQVFRGVGGSSRELANDVIKLAVAEGRSTDEALSAAVQWSRLGLTRAQVNDAVRVSLVAANVAEISASEATERLSSIMAGYNLTVADLATELAQLNSISNTLNVTNAAMLEGLSRTASVAKQAGVPLAELNALIGAAVSQTGQSGANIGNAIKSVIVALSNPVLQQALRSDFQIEVRSGSGDDLKGMSQILQELWQRYQQLNDAQRQNLLFQVAGKTQASRLAAILDSYVKAQVQAVTSQRNLNSAEEENAKIKATLKSRTESLKTAWDRFVTVQGNAPSILLGGVSPAGALTEMVTGLRNVVDLLNFRTGPDSVGSVLGAVINPGMNALRIFNAISERNRVGTADVSGQVGSMQQLGGQAQAAERSARLFRTVQESLGSMGPEARLRTIRQMSAVLSESGARELRQLNEANDERGMAVVLERERMREIEKAGALARRYNEERSSALAAAQGKLSEMESDQDTSPTNERARAIEAQSRAVDELRGKVLELGQDLEGSADIMAVAEQMRQTHLERTKSLLDQIAAAYEVPTQGPLQKFLLEKTMLEAQLAALRERQRLLQPGTAASSVNTEQAAHLDNRLRDFNRFGGLARRRDAFEFGRTQAGFDVSKFDFGVSSGDALRNKLLGTQMLMRGIRNPESNPLEGGRMIELQIRQYQTMLEIRQREAEVTREINQLQVDGMREFQKSLMGAGPGDLLRKLAAFRMNKAGVNGAQFMAMDPGMRGDMAMLNPRFNPHRMDLEVERQRLGAMVNDQGFLGLLQELSGKMAESFKAVGQQFLDEAGRGMQDLAMAAAGAVQNLANLEVLKALPGIMAQLQGGPGGAPAVQLPGFNGLNAGTPVANGK
jgi:TP901 family phage tail tape measure protein